MNLFAFPWFWPAALALILAWGGAGYWAGDYNRNNAWLAKQAAIERQAHQDYEAEVARGQAAASQSITDQKQLQQSYSLLEGKFNEIRTRGPLVVYKYRPPAPDKAGGAVGSLASSGENPRPGLPGASADGDVSLSLGAVWMWNSALTSTDTPASACGAADTATAACAAESGIGLEAAWDNHAANAKSCALDRLRQQRLIDFVGQTAVTRSAPALSSN